MKLLIEDLEGAAKSYALPDGGNIPASTEVEFDVTEDQLVNAMKAIEADADAGLIDYNLRPDPTISDRGGRIYRERFVVLHSDLDDADTSETVDSSYTFPVGAVLVGYRKKVTTAFAGGAVSALVADIGFNGAGLGDVLDDGQTIMAAAGYTFGAGANALPLIRRDIGGQKIRVKADSTDGNVADLTAGKLVVEVFYIVM